MTNTELLHAISDMMDQKLEEKLDKKLDEKLDEKLQDVVPRVKRLEEDLVPRVKGIEITMENEIIPRLSHLEQCYVDTFERYQAGIDKLDAMQRDIDVIKITVAGHSKEINKITRPYLVT